MTYKVSPVDEEPSEIQDGWFYVQKKENGRVAWFLSPVSKNVVRLFFPARPLGKYDLCLYISNELPTIIQLVPELNVPRAYYIRKGKVVWA